jgi:proteasome lid subunit RPN8/RPN11
VLWDGPAGPRLQLMRNAASSPEARARFRFDDAEWLEAVLRAARGGESLLWIIHSHVDRPPELSGEDLGTARLYPGVGWLVVSLRAGRVDACALHLRAAESRVSGGLASP